MPLPRSNWGISAQHPFLQLIYLLTLCMGLGFVILITFMGILLVAGNLSELSADPLDMQVGTLRLLQAMTSIAFFIIPGGVFALIYHKRRFKIFNSRKLSSQVILISIALVVVVLPLVYLSYKLNQGLELPESLSSWQEWIVAQEQKATQILEKITAGKTIGALVSNLLILAVLPAIGEELVFRGFMQRIFLSWTKSAHIAIFVTAILFSAMHAQFLGFLPRFLLGLLLGYLYFYSMNLFAPMIAHFTFNAISVVAAYFSYDQDIEDIGSDGSLPLYFISALLFAGLIMALYRIYRKSQENDNSLSFNAFMAKHFGNKENGTLKKNQAWHCIYKSNLSYQAEIVKSILLEQSIEAVVLNQRDSAYNTFGLLEVYVPQLHIEESRRILQEAGMEAL